MLIECVIVYAIDRQSSPEIRRHEIDHCKGWTHPEQEAPKEGQNYQAYKAPLWVRLRPYRGYLFEYQMTTKEAKKVYNGHWGCQWFRERKEHGR